MKPLATKIVSIRFLRGGKQMKKSKYSLIFILVLSISIFVKPYKAIGDVGAIDELVRKSNRY